jgi:hypothetical protein
MTYHAEAPPKLGVLSNYSNPPAFSIRARLYDIPPDESPEPSDFAGDMLSKTSKYRRHHGFSMGKGPRGKFGFVRDLTPGPGQYSPKPTMTTTARATFGASKRQLWGRCRAIGGPDPGSYDVRDKSRFQPTSYLDKSVGGVMMSRHPEKVDELGAGPAMYSPEYPMEKLPMYSFGKTRRRPWPDPSPSTREGPSPAQYKVPAVIGSAGHARFYSSAPAGFQMKGRRPAMPLKPQHTGASIAQPSCFH